MFLFVTNQREWVLLTCCAMNKLEVKLADDLNIW